MNALVFIVETLFNLYIWTFLLRFMLQAVRADFYNPFSQFIVRVTNPLVVPVRKVVPSWRGLDMSTLLLVLVLEIVAVLVLSAIAGFATPSVVGVLQVAVLRALLATLQLYFFAILLYVIVSWINPGGYNPFVSVLGAISEPLLRPFRRILPPIGGIDLSPLFVLIGLQALMLLVRS